MFSGRLRDQRGFTLIEAMVAALVLVVGFVGLAAVLIGGQNQATGDVREAQLINVADQVIEQLRAETASTGFAALAMSAAPTAPSTATYAQGTYANPNSFVQSASTCGNGSYYEIESNYDNVNTSSPSNPPANFNAWTSCGADGEPIQTLSGSATSALVQQQSTPTACSTTATILSPCNMDLGSGNSATVYTYVTDTYVPCSASGSVSCPATNASGVVTGCTTSTTFATTSTASTPCSDARRVTVAVVPNTAHPNTRATPVYISTIFTDPTPATSQQGNSIGIRVGAGL